MARSIPPWLSGILEQLELERPKLVTTSDLELICRSLDIDTPARVIASHLKKKGWLLATSHRGVWEFIPGETAGAISSSDPLLSLKAFQAANPDVQCALTFQSSAWALGLADRTPSRQDVAFPTQPKIKKPPEINPLTFRWVLSTRTAHGVQALVPESIVVHMTHRPNAVRSWQSALEWLPDVAYEMDKSALLDELEGRPSSTWARTGYLLQGMRPDIAKQIRAAFSPCGKVRFGSSQKARRNDELWQICDYLLPLNPKDMEPVR